MFWKRSSLFRKFFVVMGGLALVPVALMGLLLLNVSRRGIAASHTRLVRQVAQEVDEYFRVNTEKLMPAFSAIERKSEAWEKERLLRDLLRGQPDLLEVSLLAADGAELLKASNPRLAAEAGLVRTDRDLGFQGYLKIRRRTLAVSRQERLPILYAYFPVNQAQTLRAAISLRRLAESLAAESVGGTGFMVLVDQLGEPLLYPAERFEDPLLADFSRWPIVSQALRSTTVGPSEFVAANGQAFVGAYAPVFTIGSSVLAIQSRDEAYLALTRMRRSAVGVVGVIVGLCILGATLMARRLTDPLLTLTQAAEAVSRGDFLTQVEIKTGDELQELADTFNQMTGQLRAYSELHIDRILAEQRKTEAILFSIEDGILLVDKEKRIQLANRRALEMMGLNPQLQAEGRALSDALPDSPLRSAILEATDNPKPEAFQDVDLSVGQSHRFLRVAAHPVVSPARGAALGVLINVRDVTLEKQLDKIKEDFLQYITHDLRNPLGAAMGFVDVLLKGTVGVLNPDQHTIVASIKRSASRLMGMINNILDIAKMESGKLSLQLRTLSLAGTAGRAIAILEMLAVQKNIRVRLEAGEEFSVEADPDLVERVFANLIGNAIKYSPEGGEVVVTLTDEGPFIKACVEDHGDGIPPEYRQRVFGKFEQVKGQRRGGTGLGLTIARYFVEAHLGRIWVESDLGRGSRFYFTVPKGLCVDKEGAAVLGEKIS